MRYRGGEYNSVNSRAFIRCFDVILKTLERLLSPSHLSDSTSRSNPSRSYTSPSTN
jgi:hypothetical protein